MAVIARRHGINANQVFAWRRQYQRGQLVEGTGRPSGQEAVIVPVQVARAAASSGTEQRHRARSSGLDRVTADRDRTGRGSAVEDLGYQLRDAASNHSRSGAAMLSIPAGSAHLVGRGMSLICGRGLDGLSALVQTLLSADVLLGTACSFFGDVEAIG